MKSLTGPLLAVDAVPLDPAARAEPDVVGLITDGEQREIWKKGQLIRVTLDQADGSVDSVGALIDRYQTAGWDQESSIDVVWESVTRHCPKYLGAVKKAARAYGDPS